jgi:hypothetical protein
MLKKFVDFPAKSPAQLIGFAVLVLAVLVLANRTGIAKKIGA